MPTTRVLGSSMFHREVGGGGRGGVSLVFLHGNPTSSYLWRRVLPAVGGGGRRLAPDLIGMGESGKPAIEYSFDDHARYLDGWFDAVGVDDVVLVGHDWGGALAFDWAARHPGRVRGIAFFETIVKAMSWQEFPEAGRELFRSIKTPDVGEAMMLDQNAFIEGLAGLSEEDHAVYRRPYPTRDSRVPLLRWARSMPLGGEPADVVARVDAYGEWLAGSVDVPKLLITFRPGFDAMMRQGLVDWCVANVASLDVAEHDLVAGHHTPEEQPEAVAAALASWLDKYNL